MKFKNISVCQIIGNLCALKQSGEFVFKHDKGEIRAWLDIGTVFSVKTNTLSDFEALKVSSWIHSGEIKQITSNFPIKSMEYDAEIEKVVNEDDRILSEISFFEMASIAKTGKMPNKASIFSLNIAKINSEYPTGFVMENIKNALPMESLKAIIYGIFIGAYVLDYKTTIGMALKKYQDLIGAEVKKFFGQGMSSSFLTVVEKDMADYYSKVTIDQSLLGTEPFRIWLESMINEGKKIGKSGMFEKWDSKAKTNLNPKELSYVNSL